MLACSLMNRSWVLGGLLVAAGVGLVRGLAGARVRLTQNSRILLIGDSMAQGLGPQIKALATDARLPYLGYGIPGTRLETWANSQWLDDALAEFQPTMTLVSLGTNDAYEATPDLWSQKKVSFDALVAKLQRFSNRYSNDTPDLVYGLGSKIVWIGPPSLPATHLGMRLNGDFLTELADAAPNYFDSAALEIPRGPDELHPTVKGFAGWAGAIWQSLT